MAARERVLQESFTLLDTDQSGFIELRELKAIADKTTSAEKLQEAKETLSYLDQDGDHRVSLDEFIQAFEFFTMGFTDNDFDDFMLRMRKVAGLPMLRHAAMKAAFRHMDQDHSGYIETHELKTLVGRVAPVAQADRARGVLAMLDTNADQRVSLEEFLDVFQFLSQDYSEDEFVAMVGAMQDQGFAGIYDPEYVHPHGNQDYLGTHVVPLLRQGLLELVQQLEDNKLHLAAGTEWDEGKYMPRGWKAFSPLRWLSEWLLTHAPKDGAGMDDGDDAWPRAEASFGSMGREEKLGLLFKLLDPHLTGYVPGQLLLSLATRMSPEAGQEDIERVVDLTGVDLEGSVHHRAFTQFLQEMGSSLDDTAYTEAVRGLMALRDFRFCRDRHEKFSCLFHALDADQSGQLGMEELKALARRMDPNASEEAVQATLEFLDRDNSASVSEDEFLEAMTALLASIESDAELDMVVQRMLHFQVNEDPANEVEPEELADYIRTIPTHEVAAQLSTTAVMDLVSHRLPLVLVDVRSPQEQQVSSIPGSLSLQLEHDESAVFSYKLAGDTSEIKQALAALLKQQSDPGSKPPVVVVYCNNGERAGAAAMLCSEQLKTTVYNMCGGIINYYNQGGHVVVEPSGKHVQAIHPGDPGFVRCIIRPNNYKLE